MSTDPGIGRGRRALPLDGGVGHLAWPPGCGGRGEGATGMVHLSGIRMAANEDGRLELMHIAEYPDDEGVY